MLKIHDNFNYEFFLSALNPKNMKSSFELEEKNGGHRIISRVREAQKRKHEENEHQISPF